ncbi:MAG: hypothetical protein HKN98_00560, partial [Silicimonas sp.]|nr:hypothetical protein [Silicimonas sp.]
GTHTTSADQWEAGLRALPLPFPLTHPDRIEQNVEADTHVARNVFHIKPVSLSKRLRRWLRGQPNP